MPSYFTPALPYETIDALLSAEQQRRALGQPGLTPYQLRSFAESAIREAYYPYMEMARRGEELAEKRREFDIQTKLEERQMEKAEKASRLGAITQLGATALGTYAQYRLMSPLLEALKKEAIPSPTTAPPAVSTQSIITSLERQVGYMPALHGERGPEAIDPFTGRLYRYDASGNIVGTFDPQTGAMYSIAGETTVSPEAAVYGAPSYLPYETAAYEPPVYEVPALQEAPPYGEAVAGYSAYAPYVAGALRAGVGIASGEKPKEAVAAGGGTAAGAYYGAQVGSYFGPYGAAIGAVLGGIVGSIFGKKVGQIKTGVRCLIVSALHGESSKEVNLARKFRNRFLSDEEVRGYYILADALTPLMEASKKFKEYVKREIVDKLIEYAHWVFDGKPASSKAISVTMSFLGLCRTLGKEELQ